MTLEERQEIVAPEYEELANEVAYLQEDLHDARLTIATQRVEIEHLLGERKMLTTLTHRYRSMLGGKRMGEGMTATTHFYLWLCTLPGIGRLFDRSLEKAFETSEQQRRQRKAINRT